MFGGWAVSQCLSWFQGHEKERANYTQRRTERHVPDSKTFRQIPGYRLNFFPDSLLTITHSHAGITSAQLHSDLAGEAQRLRPISPAYTAMSVLLCTCSPEKNKAQLPFSHCARALRLHSSLLGNVLCRAGREDLSALGKAPSSLESQWRAQGIQRSGGAPQHGDSPLRIAEGRKSITVGQWERKVLMLKRKKS